MQFNFGAGLSAMGASIADTAGKAAIEMQKSNLEQEKLKLANDLATERETSLATLQHGQRLEEIQKTSDIGTEADKTRKKNELDIQLQYAPKLAEAQRQTIIDQGNDKDWLAASRKIALADPVKQAEIFKDMQAGYASKLSLQIAQQTADAHTELATALKNGDEEAAGKARLKIDALDYSAKDMLSAASVANSQAAIAERATKTAQVALTAVQTKYAGDDSDEAKQQIDAAQEEYDTLRRSSDAITRLASQRAAEMPGARIGGATRAKPTVPLTLFDKDAGPPGTTPGATSLGLINGPLQVRK